MAGREIRQEQENGVSGALERQERLLYLADMVGELKLLAERDGCQTLSTLLALSHAEALAQVHGKAYGP